MLTIQARHLLVLLTLLATAVWAQLATPVVGENVEYIVQENENLLDIALKHALAIEHIAFANGLPETATKVAKGTVLTLPKARILPASPPKTGLVLNVPERGMYFFRDGKFVRFIPVSVGKPPGAKSPLGQFHVIEKIEKPTWYPPAWADSRKPVPPGPDNPLGAHWIGLSAHMVGLHGTNDPLNVGAPVTHGCIRLYPTQVAELFNDVSVGMPVRLDYETVKLGKQKNGQLVLATFPDIYKKESVLESTKKVVTQANLPSLIQNKRFLALVGLNLGTAFNLQDLKNPLMTSPKSEPAQGFNYFSSPNPKE
jgi:L,D-transpeptidase ErfK/SrfK